MGGDAKLCNFCYFLFICKSMRFARYLWGLEVGERVLSYEDLT
jgi:hypothetical protein